MKEKGGELKTGGGNHRENQERSRWRVPGLENSWKTAGFWAPKCGEGLERSKNERYPRTEKARAFPWRAKEERIGIFFGRSITWKKIVKSREGSLVGKEGV